jgi:hypothetical protein
MPCDEWCRLVERYRNAVNAYNEQMNALVILPGAVFNEIWSRSELARTKCDIRRADVLQHEHDHACLEAGQHKRAQKSVPNKSGEFGHGGLAALNLNH